MTTKTFDYNNYKRSVWWRIQSNKILIYKKIVKNYKSMSCQLYSVLVQQVKNKQRLLIYQRLMSWTWPFSGRWKRSHPPPTINSPSTPMSFRHANCHSLLWYCNLIIYKDNICLQFIKSRYFEKVNMSKNVSVLKLKRTLIVILRIKRKYLHYLLLKIPGQFIIYVSYWSCCYKCSMHIQPQLNFNLAMNGIKIWSQKERMDCLILGARTPYGNCLSATWLYCKPSFQVFKHY